SPIAAFLQRSPSGGIHHLCYEVADIEAARDTLRAAGARVLGDGEPKIGAHGKPVLFLHPKDFNGTLVELEQAWGEACAFRSQLPSTSSSGGRCCLPSCRLVCARKARTVRLYRVRPRARRHGRAWCASWCSPRSSRPWCLRPCGLQCAQDSLILN